MIKNTYNPSLVQTPSGLWLSRRAQNTSTPHPQPNLVQTPSVAPTQASPHAHTPSSTQQLPWTEKTLAGKTLWEWMSLLLIPLLVGIGTVAVTWQQTYAQNSLSAQQYKSAQEIARQARFDDLLKNYWDNIDTLVLNNGLKTSANGSEARSIAHSRTLSILRQVNASRKTAIIAYLADLELVQGTYIENVIGKQYQIWHTKEPIISLDGADLQGADLRDSDLDGADLRGANLREANLIEADLRGANLRGANLNDAELREVDLGGANLSKANLNGVKFGLSDLTEIEMDKKANFIEANFSDANLSGADFGDTNLANANFSGANLSRANLEGTYLADANFRGASFYEVDFSEIDLSSINLSDAHLICTDLRGANLRKTILKGADLSGANLSEAKNTTPSQLSQALSLSLVPSCPMGQNIPSGRMTGFIVNDEPSYHSC